MNPDLTFTIAQLNPIVGNLPHNLKKIQQVIEKNSDNGLIVFSEMVLSGYPPEDLVLKAFFMDQIEECVATLIEESSQSNSTILLPTPWRENGHLYNAVHLIANGEIIATRYKNTLPNYGVFDEQRIFTAGPLPEPIEFQGYKLGVMICEDLWRAETANHLKQKGADILIIPNGSPYELNKQQTRYDLAKARIQETGLPLIYVNQVGGQDELVFDGGSFVMNGHGKIIHQCPFFEESIQQVTLNIDNDFTLLLQEDNPQTIYKALTLGLHDYVVKNGFPGVLIGLSGGIDSALSAAIAADALGPDKVRCVMMPSPYTSSDSLEDAAACAELLGISLEEIPISPGMDAFHAMLETALPKDAPATTFENIQSRLRGLILMSLSNASGSMVMSTGNKSEMAVGYATLYGDMCGGFNVLKDVYKTQVYALSNWRNTQNMVIPERIITKAPTAELKPNQSDQDSLPPYAVLDDILNGLIEKDWNLEDIAQVGHDPDIIKKVWTLLDRAEYKRRQAPPGVKITAKAFGRDRRYPITNGFSSF